MHGFSDNYKIHLVFLIFSNDIQICQKCQMLKGVDYPFKKKKKYM